MSTRRSLIGTPADRRLSGLHSLHCAGEKSIASLAEGAQPVAVLIPALGEGLEARERLTDFEALRQSRHPEWNFEDNPTSRALFAVVGEAAREHAPSVGK